MLSYRGEKIGGIGKRMVDIVGPGSSAEGMNKDMDGYVSEGIIRATKCVLNLWTTEMSVIGAIEEEWWKDRRLVLPKPEILWFF